MSEELKNIEEKDPRYIERGIAVLLTCVGCVLLISAFWVDPTGIIDNSVLIAFGEIMTFVGAILGVDYVWSERFRRAQKRDKQ